MITIEKLVVGSVMTNCYIIYDEAEKDALVVDPGAAAGKIAEKIRERKLHLRGILLTHGHFDHILAADDVRREFGVKLFCSVEEKELAADPCLNAGQQFGCARGVLADETFTDGEILTFGALTVRVIATPGHTGGGVCFYFEPEGVLFSGDTLFFESVGRTDFPTGNAGVLADSIREKLFSLPGQTQVFPGHGPATNIAYEKENNAYVNEEGYLY